MLHIWPDEQGAEGKSSRSKDTSSSLCWNTHRCCSQTKAQWSSCDPDRRQTHHATEVLVQNLHKVVNQFVHRQLVLWRQERCKVYCNEFGSYFMLGLICLILWVELLRCLCLNAFHNNFRMYHLYLLDCNVHYAQYNWQLPLGYGIYIFTLDLWHTKDRCTHYIEY